MVNTQVKFWKGKRVLITGYEGFLGSNLAKVLLNFGAKISGLDILTRRKDTILTQKELAKIKIIKGNVDNLSLVKRILRNDKIEVIFHLAAEALVGECLKRPVKGFSTNIKGTWNILEAWRQTKIAKAIVVASSDKAYGSHSKLPYKEDSALCGLHPYDVSKSCADLIAHAYHNTYGAPVVITRCGNIFGPGDFNFSRIVPETLRSVIRNKTLVIRSDGKFTRDYVYVDDIVAGYINLAQKSKKLKLFGQAFNFSAEQPLSVLALVKLIYKLADRRSNYKILKQAKYEIKHQYLSSRKAARVLGWKPKLKLDKALEKTYQWYKDNLSK
ncbi:MAG: GDP-mannose 4,6-dehydratase [Candidatus Omnitrophica bacterium]|nr:GDP-mannose 4,6-dehydratase [Candidatus Omnitrophota bacterium]